MRREPPSFSFASRGEVLRARDVVISAANIGQLHRHSWRQESKRQWPLDTATKELWARGMRMGTGIAARPSAIFLCAARAAV
jgi:hypothetical protein